MGHTNKDRRAVINDGVLCVLLLFLALCLSGCFGMREICSIDDKTGKPNKLIYSGWMIRYKVKQGYGYKDLANETWYIVDGKRINKSWGDKALIKIK